MFTSYMNALKVSEACIIASSQNFTDICVYGTTFLNTNYGTLWGKYGWVSYLLLMLDVYTAVRILVIIT